MKSLACAALVAGSTLAATAAAAAPLYVRAGGGWAEAADVTLRDHRCASEAPPALFGCGPGSDGRPMAARGELEAAALGEAALGAEIAGRWRLELALATRELDLAAAANFRGVSGEQPVASEGRSTTAMARLALDLGPRRWRARPFVAAAVGAARHELDRVVYAFPGIAASAVTVVQGGDHSALAWQAGAGAAVRLSPAWHLDVEVRHTDLGELRTDAGAATIVRPRGTFELAIDGTRAELETRSVALSLRYRLGSARRR